MRLNNRSIYYSPDLRAFFRAGLEWRGLSSPEIKRYFIDVYTFVPRRRPKKKTEWRSAHGVALIGYPSLVMRLSAYPDRLNLIEVAQVFIHEVDHTLGLNHREMADWWKMEMPWLGDLKIRTKEYLKIAASPPKGDDPRFPSITVDLRFDGTSLRAMGKTIRAMRLLNQVPEEDCLQFIDECRAGGNDFAFTLEVCRRWVVVKGANDES